jgi:cell division protein FtsW (lipid II flippase)
MHGASLLPRLLLETLNIAGKVVNKLLFLLIADVPRVVTHFSAPNLRTLILLLLIVPVLHILIPLCLLLIGLDLGNTVFAVAAGIAMRVAAGRRVHGALHFRHGALGALMSLLPLLLLDLPFDVVQVVLAHVCVQVVASLAPQEVAG